MAASFSVANINPGSVRSEFMLAVMALIERERARQHEIDPLVPHVRFDQFYSQLSAPYLDDERNRCVLWFLNNTKSDYLLFIDSDIGFTPDQPYALIEAADAADVKVLTGIYYNNFEHYGLCALAHRWGQHPVYPRRDLIPITVAELQSLTPQDKPHPVDACGAGFLAIHRQVFLDMLAKSPEGDPCPCFAELVIEGVHMGEDFTFCIRATALGHTPHVLPSISVDHYKTCAIRIPKEI